METRTRNRVIAFRVTPAERRNIEAKVRQSGLRQQEYLLHAALETPIYSPDMLVGRFHYRIDTLLPIDFTGKKGH